ncbi:hypothetical protein G6F57_014086 [Rhizopus arrhizus]|uniref:Reverse transcriptase domain-containing protein n=1 Tax=Rhizopus oryzae TaxID=64495 RepID=A0A9P6WXJ9_RHIOR|nr:hypothetical protein G6F23_010962 [Rhizopus arrhizus]KAG1398000.1 hypothetical protein G6F58_011414 [Rhizopus delemar]KAG0753755.1 hypothetical protein G6F24_012812 [Rhizopus arrhizus]KAG0904911.1 hypothetical protein G6F33_012573 [Rhizopus arrhizus]KAG0928453.1 hypothetical protein G6F30_012356 [Rhizopus arrhizus]
MQSITNAPVEHCIDTGNAVPIVKRGRRLSPKESKALHEEVQKMLEAKVIRPSNSPWCSPPVMVPKPDGSMRLCTNYRGLNAVTRKDTWPLPRMDELVDKLLVAEEDKCKTAFTTGSALYEYNVMPFGLTNAPATFARFMNKVLGHVEHAIVYLDDVLIYSKTREEHVQHVDAVLSILNQWNLKVNTKKCSFFKDEARFLGFIVTGTGVRSNPDKVEPIRTWPRPTKIPKLQSFLGLCNFYHRFMKNMSSIAAPLYKLLRKDQGWRWEDAEEKAFQRLKEMMSELPELGYPDSNLPYEVHCDASNTGIGAVLVQMGRPIAFASKSLSPAQRNYSTTERECLAVAWALQHFHCYVHGCASLTVYTDHAALKAILSTKDPKGRIARWIMDIASYEFTVFHKKGVDNADADALSRIKRQDVKINQQGVAEDFTLTNIARLQTEDLELKKYVSRSAGKSLVEMNSIWYYKTKQGRLVVYLPKKLRNGYLWLIHAHPTSGHMGRDKSIDKACENAWWPDMVKDVKNFVKTCETCLRHKAPTHKFVELKSIEISEPGEVWAVLIARLNKKLNKKTIAAI